LYLYDFTRRNVGRLINFFKDTSKGKEDKNWNNFNNRKEPLFKKSFNR
tara:strand:+ start:1654 stop:1797 length:144 start_codon:yes stop_codon:yes gene_type:complete